jgi:hypothetical protein
MIQDTPSSPEMYLSRLSGNECGGWGLSDNHQLDDDHVNYADLLECNSFWVVSVPGETDWCAKELDGDDDSTTCMKLIQVLELALILL